MQGWVCLYKQVSVCPLIPLVHSHGLSSHPVPRRQTHNHLETKHHDTISSATSRTHSPSAITLFTFILDPSLRSSVCPRYSLPLSPPLPPLRYPNAERNSSVIVKFTYETTDLLAVHRSRPKDRGGKRSRKRRKCSDTRRHGVR